VKGRDARLVDWLTRERRLLVELGTSLSSPHITGLDLDLRVIDDIVVYVVVGDYICHSVILRAGLRLNRLVLLSSLVSLFLAAFLAARSRILDYYVRVGRFVNLLTFTL
jgi:hypothetical protein